MRSYLIDGNNLMGKISAVKKIQNKDKESARGKIVFLIENYFHNKKVKIYLHFDGFENIPLKISKGKIIYSEKSPADQIIKEQIEKTKNRKNLIVVSSDREVQNFAKVCGCGVLSSEEFAGDLSSTKKFNEEENRIRSINNIEEFKKLFNVDK